jgi:hypothetical protein
MFKAKKLSGRRFVRVADHSRLKEGVPTFLKFELGGIQNADKMLHQLVVDNDPTISADHPKLVLPTYTIPADNKRVSIYKNILPGGAYDMREVSFPEATVQIEDILDVCHGADILSITDGKFMMRTYDGEITYIIIFHVERDE